MSGVPWNCMIKNVLVLTLPSWLRMRYAENSLIKF
jgi:hypothetical protein